MNIARRFKSLSVLLSDKNEKQVEEEYFYFTLPHDPLLADFSHADIGCGSGKAKATLLGYPERHADIGIDATMEDTQADVVCRLGLEELPLEKNSQDLVTAYDLLEHIPKVCVVPKNGKLVYIYPTVELFNEIYRVLKPGGYLEAVTPGIPNYLNGAVRDPTHVSFYCIESFDYFCTGRFEQLTHSYGLHHSFEKLKVHWKSASHIQAVLQKPINER